MDPALIDDEYVQRASALLGLQLTAAQLPGVVENLRRTAQIAAAVNAFPLEPAADESGPVWRP